MDFPGQKFAKFLVDDSLKAIDEFEKEIDKINQEEKIKNRRMIKWFIAIVCLLLITWSYFFWFRG